MGPGMLIVSEKQERSDDVQRYLEQRNIDWYVTMNGTWIHHFTSWSYQPSAEWLDVS